jgi:hypothetical protein
VQYQIESDVLARPIEESLVLFHPGTERLMTLNECGARIWELLSVEPDAERIIARLLQEFDGVEAEIRQQVLEFLAQLQRERLIRRRG